MLKKDFIDLTDFTKEELQDIINLSIDFKKNRRNPGYQYNQTFLGKHLIMIFEKNSLRTRLSFDIAIKELGGSSSILNKSDIHLGEKETIEDTVKVISRMADILMIRAYSHDMLKKAAQNSTIPVINGLDNFSHPCQIISSLSAIKDKFGEEYDKKIFTWVGPYNNVLHSYIEACEILGIPLHVSSPKGFEIPGAMLAERKEKGIVKIFNLPHEAVKCASVVITDTWVSMGDTLELSAQEIKDIFLPYQVNKELMQYAQSDAIFTHCLPAIRGNEVTADVIDSPCAIVFDEAEYRLHSQKAIMVYISGFYKK